MVEGGRIVAEGTHAELLATEPRYAEILAQTEDDARSAPTSASRAIAHEHDDERLLDAAIDADVAERRELSSTPTSASIADATSS